MRWTDASDRVRWRAVSLTGAVLTTFAFAAGAAPRRLIDAFDEGALVSVGVFFGVYILGRRAVRYRDRSAWVWSSALGAAMATAETAGISLTRRSEADLRMLVDGDPWIAVWMAVHWLGSAWVITVALALLFELLDREASVHVMPGRLARTWRALAARVAGSRPGALAIVFG